MKKLFIVLIILIVLSMLSVFGVYTFTSKFLSVIQPGSMVTGSKYIIFKDGTNYYARNGQTGKIDYNDYDAARTINWAFSQMNIGDELLIKSGIYPINSPLTPISETFIRGEGRSTILRANKILDRIIDLRDVLGVKIFNMRVEGNGRATRGIDAARSVTFCTLHHIVDCVILGATHANVDLSGSEDASLTRCYIDGHNVPGGVATTKYNVIVGGTNGVNTGGVINIYDSVIGFAKYADIYVNKIEQLRIYGGSLASHKSFSPDLKAQILCDDGGPIELYGTWLEGGGPNVPNIKVENNPCRELAIYSSRIWCMECTNIYSTLPNAFWSVVISGGVIQPNTVESDIYAIQIPAYSVHIIGTDIWTNDGYEIDLTGVTNYYISPRNKDYIKTNRNFIT